MFEHLKAKIQIFEKTGVVSPEELIDSMYALCLDFDGSNTVLDIKKYGNALVNLFDRLVPLYRENSQIIEKLNDEDVNEVVEKANEIEVRLKEIRPVIEKLIEEDRRLSVLKKEYDKECQKQKNLEEEISRLGDISIEKIQKINEKLEQEIEEKTKNKHLLAQVLEKLSIEKSDNENMLQELKQCEAKRKEQEKEKKKLVSSIDEYNDWAKNFDKEMKKIKDDAFESSAKLNAIRNAWESVKNRPELSEALKVSEAFSKISSEINSYTDLEQWMDDIGMQIEQQLVTYSNMYNVLLETMSTIS